MYILTRKELMEKINDALHRRFDHRKEEATKNFERMKMEHDALLYTQGMRKAFDILGIDLADEIEDILIAYENERA